MRILFNFLAICVGFLMVVATLGVVTGLTASALEISSHDTPSVVGIASLVFIGFLVFLWLAGRILRMVGPAAPHTGAWFSGVATPPPLPQTRGDSMNGDEARIMQEIYNGLTQMEKRIESLETILIERHRETPWPVEK